VYDVFNAARSETSNQKRVEQMLTAAGIVAVVSQIFQANDHTSVWLAFALAWIACALGAIVSSSLVFRVAEVRNRVIAQQRARRPRR
jgi:ABC-type branched-subunit amino acid transport system permease subunit